MYVNNQSRLCFLAHPRTASRAVRDALIKKHDFFRIGDHHSGPPQHDLGNRLAFCVVRNHWDALVSWFFNMGLREPGQMTIQWIGNHISSHKNYFRPCKMWWFLYEVPNLVVLRYENLDTELNAFLGEHGLAPIKLAVVGASADRKGRDYRDFFNKKTRDYVEWQFRAEIAHLGYSFES